ncbi:MAG TPA: FHA domain-containing protein [Anaeromyxobacter sp.]|nr:FHA domain-containing protein [Anaeromyxobacter sp.]
MAKPTRCPRCGLENDPSAAFCLDCGQSLRAARDGGGCGACGAPVQPGFRFCGVCGKPVGPAPTARGAPGATGAAPAGPTGTGPHAARPAPARGRAAPGPRLRLTLVRSDGSPGTTYPLDRGDVVCGRTQGDLRLADDPTVSPRHVRFTRDGGALRVQDLGSVNGTFVRLRAPRRVSVGEEIRVGRQVLRLEPLPRPPGPAAGGVRPWGTPDRGARFRLSQLLEDGGLGEVFPLHDGENVLGREAGDVTFPSDRYVSARHARIEVRGDEITLADTASSNGTFVKLAGTAELSAGDELLVGGQLIRVEET